MAKKITMSVNKFEKLYKETYQRFLYTKGYENLVLIMGCQRSGTTLITSLLNRLRFTRVFGEYSELSNIDDNKIRLNPKEVLLNQISKVHAPLIVLKPLVESQKAEYWTNTIDRSSILWVYRSYKDVALSSSKKTQSEKGHSNILSIIENKPNDWRNENVSKETREVLNSLYDRNLTPVDAACLFWYARNILFFEQALNNKASVSIWKYEKFLREPNNHVKTLLSTFGSTYSLTKDLSPFVYTSSIDTAENKMISPDIENLCEHLQKKLDEQYSKVQL